MREQVINILQEIRPEFNFNDSANYIEDGLLDSFDVVRLVAELDEEFNTSIDGEDIMPKNFSSVEKIMALLQKKGVKS